MPFTGAYEFRRESGLDGTDILKRTRRNTISVTPRICALRSSAEKSVYLYTIPSDRQEGGLHRQL